MFHPLPHTNGGMSSYPPVQLAMEHGKFTAEASLTGEINELKAIIGELTIANETLKRIRV